MKRPRPAPIVLTRGGFSPSSEDKRTRAEKAAANGIPRTGKAFAAALTNKLMGARTQTTLERGGQKATPNEPMMEYGRKVLTNGTECYCDHLDVEHEGRVGACKHAECDCTSFFEQRYNNLLTEEEDVDEEVELEDEEEFDEDEEETE